ncbi:hypothetical protein KI387_031409, partial [Taxus chinensis]
IHPFVKWVPSLNKARVTDRLLIIVKVMKSPGALKLIVNKDDSVEKVVEKVL